MERKSSPDNPSKGGRPRRQHLRSSSAGSNASACSSARGSSSSYSSMDSEGFNKREVERAKLESKKIAQRDELFWKGFELAKAAEKATIKRDKQYQEDIKRAMGASLISNSDGANAAPKDAMAVPKTADRVKAKRDKSRSHLGSQKTTDFELAVAASLDAHLDNGNTDARREIKAILETAKRAKEKRDKSKASAERRSFRTTPPSSTSSRQLNRSHRSSSPRPTENAVRASSSHQCSRHSSPEPVETKYIMEHFKVMDIKAEKDGCESTDRMLAQALQNGEIDDEEMNPERHEQIRRMSIREGKRRTRDE